MVNNMIILLVLFATLCTHHVAIAMVVDWDLYNMQQQYKKAGGILYKQSVLKPHEYKVITDELQSMKLAMIDEDESLSFATNRSGAQIPIDADIYRVLSSKEGSLCRLVNSLFDSEGKKGESAVLAPDIPVEIRVYEKQGAGMEWHIDDVLYTPEQIEVVYTIDNVSDCMTMWQSQEQQQSLVNDEKQKSIVQSVQTTPNSAILIKAGSVMHKVSPLTVGKRTILKMAFVLESAVMDESMKKHATHHSKPTKKKRKGKSGKYLGDHAHIEDSVKSIQL